MSGVVSVFTSVFVGVMLAATNFAPLIGWHRFLENRRRVFNAVLLFAGSLLLLMAGIFLAAIDVVIQYEDQGLLFWNPILTTATVLGGLGLLALLGARLSMPKPNDYLVFDGSSALERLHTLFTQEPSAPPPPTSRRSADMEPETPPPRPESLGFRPEPAVTPSFAH